ncbi:MAG: hypothetical protein IT320_05645 [Anaerolineae bacterium]|nr:hypothetical protein [Anaerolineae bacterium]
MIARSGLAPYQITWAGNLYLVAFVGVTLVGLLVDFFCLAMAGAAISREVETRRWTLLRLTLLSEDSLVGALHAVVRLRVWRLLQVVAGLRGGLCAILAIEMFDFHFTSSFEVFQAVVLFLVLCVPYVIEPFWRTQALIETGLNISTLNRSTSLTLLTAAFVLLVIWLLQIVIVGALAVLIYFVLDDAMSPSNEARMIFFMTLSVACFWLLNYALYARLEHLSRKRTLRQLARLDA